MWRQIGTLVRLTPFSRARRRRRGAASLRLVGPLAVSAMVVAALLGPLPYTQAARSVHDAVTAKTIPVTLMPSLPSPQPVGTAITWTATATDTVPLVYRFSDGTSPSGPFTVQRDFSPKNSYTVAPMQEGTFYVQVTVAEGYNSTTSSSIVASFTFSSRVGGGRPVVNPTGNPLVALYSAPACSAGVMRVAFRQVGTLNLQYTYGEQCRGNQSRNFLVAGMLPNTSYLMVNVVSGTTVVTSTPVLFTTGSIPPSLIFPQVTVPISPGAQTDTADGLVYHLLTPPTVGNSPNPFATNLQGQTVWYQLEPDLSAVWALRVQQLGGNVGTGIYLTGDDNQVPNVENVLRLTDLAGNPLLETNIQELNAQLQARGQEPIYGFHHDALSLPNGDIAVLGLTEQTITTTANMGDMLIVLNPNLQVVWTWDAFNTMDVYRGPTLNDTCVGLPQVLCSVPGYPNVIDWTHANAIAYSPSDGNLVVSLRNQDWVIKLNFANGSGDGSILWRLGPSGDFRIKPLDPQAPFPWFSHQHDFNYIDGNTIELFDNGNTRNTAFGCTGPGTPLCDSRGQVYTINDQAKVITQTLNVDLGDYSIALGVAQRLSDGHYSFTSGFQLSAGPPFAQDIEVLGDGSGTKTYMDQLNTTEYRGWRVATLYSPINAPCPSCSAPAQP